MRLWVLLILSLSFAFSYRPPQPEADRISRPFLVPPAQMKLFTFGHNENLADSLWLRLIQDIDHCQTGVRDGLCRDDKGWVFHMLDAITETAPLFRSPYAFGATVLGVVVNDKEGARIIYDRAVERFPNDWPILYRAAHHQLNELGQPERAAELLVQAGKNGAPAWVFALAAKLFTAEGKAFMAKTVLEDMIKQDPDSKYAPRLRERLKEVEAELAKQKSTGAP